jgi:hypothetical protein
LKTTSPGAVAERACGEGEVAGFRCGFNCVEKEVHEDLGDLLVIDQAASRGIRAGPAHLQRAAFEATPLAFQHLIPERIRIGDAEGRRARAAELEELGRDAIEALSLAENPSDILLDDRVLPRAKAEQLRR